MNSTGPKSMVDLLRLAPPEERLLKRIVSPDPPGRVKRFFQRPVRDLRGVMVAILLLIGIVIGIVLLAWAVAAMGSLLDESTQAVIKVFMAFAFLVAVFVSDTIRENKVVLLERVILRLYGALEEGARQV